MSYNGKSWQRLLEEIWEIVIGGHAFEVEELTVTDNGTYTAPEGKAYSPVTVNVAIGGNCTAIITDDGEPLNGITAITHDAEMELLICSIEQMAGCEVFAGLYFGIGDDGKNYIVTLQDENGDIVETIITNTVTSDLGTFIVFQVPSVDNDGYYVDIAIDE